MKKEISIKLEGMGFKETQTKLFTKQLNDTLWAYWDYRKTEKGNFYCSNTDGGGFMSDKDAKELDEYKIIRDPDFKTGKTIQKEQKDLQVLDNKNQAYDLINQRDDDQVLIEIQGGFLKDFIYSFPTKEGNVTGLSWAGVKEIARQMGNISIEDLEITETPDTYRVKAKAKDITKNVSMYGVTEQSKQITTKSGTKIDDLHALSKCVSRSQRNAIRGLIPENLIKAMIEEYNKKQT